MNSQDNKYREVVSDAPEKLRTVGESISRWGTEDRRRVFLIIAIALCIGFFIPVYYFDMHVSKSFLHVDVNETFSLYQLMTDPDDYHIDDEGIQFYSLYLIAPAVMALLAYRWKGRDLFKFACIPSVLYLVLFFASRHVTMDEDYVDNFGLTFFGVVYLIALAVATAISIWEVVELRRKATDASGEKSSPVLQAAPSFEAGFQQFAPNRKSVEPAVPSQHPTPTAATKNQTEPVQDSTAAMKAQDPARATQPRFCFKCGAPLNPADRFCGECGQEVRKGK